jgi:hypothetical protein
MRYPSDWARHDLEGQDGAIFLPNPADPRTSLSARVDSLALPVVAEDLEELKAGVSEGLSRLTDCKLEQASDVVLGNLIRFARVFVYREADAVCKRKVWLIYVDRWLIVLTWQGSSEQEYEYWLAMANYSFATLDLPQALWFATDRNLSA